ncbi:conserved hypothetical protein [Leishmania major strain Friedlin]|uniref:Uncharacterized protein n=1 Tax=Leishmania major TaxID=5664 RepID=Q4QHD9_LEIMA|nr:conserved hypothetical protein [Leishmania major strain Friedlin]CAG9570056.1 hypothetical_protein_-_conserved [Leishmania major strain Friedlin]CAJ02768.1 conserved hypothetical protein [Leishmania major strain Friedlin]|eukprot:XP_001681409.1 conserved hypothetical protein [Leishmania major strain Friedlin]
MNRAFLSDLAWRISLHPSCRAELRRHWPAPHYHKTPHDIEEAEEQPRCQATGASPPVAAVASQDESKKSGGGGSWAFNPYETFSLRLKRKRKEPVKAGCRSRCGEAALPGQHQQQQQQTRMDASQAKAMRQIRSNSPSSNSTSSPARVVGVRLNTSSASSLTRASKLSSSLVVTAKPAAAVANAKRAAANKSKSTSAPAASSSALASGQVKAVAAAHPSPSTLASASSQQRVGRVVERSASLPLIRAAAAAATVTKAAASTATKESDEVPTSVVDDSASAAPAKSKRDKNKAKSVHVDANDTKLKTVRNRAAATTTGGPSIGPAVAKKKKTAGHCSSTIGSNAADSDNGSERAGYIRDPLNIRLPHSPPYRGRQTAGRNGHRPVHVTIRWSGARQRRRRFFAQYPALAQPEKAMYLQQLICRAEPSPSLDGREVALDAVASEEKHYSGAQEKVPHQGFTPPRVPRSVNFSDAATTVGQSAPRPPSTVAGTFLSDSTPRADARLQQQQQQQKLCSGDRKAGHTTTTTATTGRRASLSSTGGHAAARLHARMRSQGEDEKVALYAVASNASINESNSGALPVRPFARHPPLKGTSTLSQSTNTAARTSALSISGSEMPTPSSTDNYSATLHSAVCRPNSLFIVRSPPQDYADEAAAYGSYYYSRQVGVAGNSSGPLAAMGPIGSHSLHSSSGGVASASGPNRLRVTYVTANACSTTRTWCQHHHSLSHSTDRGSSPYQPSSLAPANPSASQSMASALSCATLSPHVPQQQQQQQRQKGGGPRGVAHIQRPHPLNAGGPSLPDPRPSGKVWYNLDSPTLVNSAASRTGDGGGDGDGGDAHAESAFSALPSPSPSATSTPLPSTTLCAAAAAAGPRIMMRSATIRGDAATHAGGGTGTPPPLNVKTVMAQRHCSCLLCRQQQQERSSPAPVGDSAPVATACNSGPLPHFPHENSSSSSAAGTVAFSPPTVHVASNPSCSDSQPRRQKLQQSSIISAPSPRPPQAPVPLGVAPGSVQPLAGKRATSTQHRARAGEGAIDEPRSSGGVGSRETDGAPCHRTSVHAQRQSSHFSFTNLAEIRRTGELLKLPQQHSHSKVPATNQLSAESSLHLFATGEGGVDYSNASSVQLTQQYLDSSPQPVPCLTTPHTRRDSERDLQAPSFWHPVYTATRLYAASESTAWLENNSFATVTATPAMSTVWGHGTSTGPHAGYLCNSNNFMFSEPATPLCWTQQRNSSGLVPSHQRVSSCSLASTSLLSHPHLHTPSFGTMGSTLPQGARRTPLGLPRSPSLVTSTATPTAAAPQVFCKYQRPERQRRRRRFPRLLPGTRCPGMAGRLAFDAHRAAVRSGAIAEAEECSYYLSHERCTSASAMPGTSLTTPHHRSTVRQSSPSLSPLLSGSPLCVVSLADCRANFSHDAASTSTTGDGRNAKAHWDEGTEESDEMGDEDEETTFGTPRFLFHIPPCCDDPYHRDEEALEMLSITTTSSCAFGAGLDGLRWQDWMPSSPLETSEVMLRTVEQAAATATEAAASTHARDSNRLSTIADSNNRGIKDALGSGQAETEAGARAAHAVDSFVTGSAAAAGLGAPSSSVATSSRQPLGAFAEGGKVVSTDIAAPRNSEDLVCVTCRAMDSASAGGIGEGATDLHDSPTGASHDFSNSLNAPGGGKRPFIAEWIVSKLQKRMEKKKKMQRKQLEREAAAAEAAGMDNTLQFRLEGGSESLPSPAGAPRAHSRTSSMSDCSDAGPPCGGYFSQAFKSYGSRCLLCSSPMMPTGAKAAQQHRQRLAYLAAAYQTELVIHEQKRREAEENRRGLEALVHRYRAKMTPAAAVAGYYYEAHVVTSPTIFRPHAQPHKESLATSSLKPTTTNATAAAKAAYTVSEGSSNGVNPSGSRSYSIGSEEHAGDAAVEAHSAMSFWFPRIPEQGNATPPPPPLTHTSKAGKGRSNTISQQQSDTTGRACAKTTAAASSSEAAKLKPSCAAAPERQPHCKREHRDCHAFAVPSTVEAERVRVALDTVKTKKQAIESWIFGLRL